MHSFISSHHVLLRLRVAAPTRGRHSPREHLAASVHRTRLPIRTRARARGRQALASARRPHALSGVGAGSRVRLVFGCYFS